MEDPQTLTKAFSSGKDDLHPRLWLWRYLA